MREIGASETARRGIWAESAQEVMAVDAASQIADPLLSRLYAYWDGKRGERRFPGRGDLDPVDIPGLLAHVFLISVRHDPFDLVFRLAGTAVTDGNGGDITGMRLMELPGTVAGELYRQSARTVYSGQPVLVSGALRNRAAAYKRADHLILPLGSLRGVVDMLIGAAVFRPYGIGERPDEGRRAPRTGPGLQFAAPSAPMDPGSLGKQGACGVAGQTIGISERSSIGVRAVGERAAVRPVPPPGAGDSG